MFVWSFDGFYFYLTWAVYHPVHVSTRTACPSQVQLQQLYCGSREYTGIRVVRTGRRQAGSSRFDITNVVGTLDMAHHLCTIGREAVRKSFCLVT